MTVARGGVISGEGQLVSVIEVSVLIKDYGASRLKSLFLIHFNHGYLRNLTLKGSRSHREMILIRPGPSGGEIWTQRNLAAPPLRTCSVRGNLMSLQSEWLN